MGTDGDGSESIRPATHRLLLDVMLGKLAVYLRVCGYDAAYAGDRGIEADDRIRDLAAAETRVLLTRDESLADRTDDAVLLSEREVEAQLGELAAADVALSVTDAPERCGHCNGRLEPLDPGAETPEYAPDPGETDCWQCRDCGQVFWQGSHFERMADTIERAARSNR